jgi:pyridoxal phosphate enzyme (YggS family)
MNRQQAILIEVNTSGELSKSGVNPNEFFELLKKINNLENLQVSGLMTIGALSTNVDKVRNCFKLLKNLFEESKSIYNNNLNLKYISMGMSNDYKIAIEEGANLLRLGTIIFADRNYHLENSNQ